MKKTISYISFIVHENKIFNINDNLLCAISGGQDSILLTSILYHLQVFYDFKLNLIYCNHLWQLKNFFIEFQLFKFAYLLNSPIILSIPKSQITSEKSGHVWRQKCLFQIRNYYNSTSIILGHTASDQVETALWHLFRGAGSHGLLSLKSVSTFTPIKFLNPLICLNSYKKQHHRFKFIKSKRTSKSSNFLTRYSLVSDILNLDFFDNSLINFQKLNAQDYYIFTTKPTSPTINVIKRPLLNFYRSPISNLVNQTRLPIIFDKTNTSKKLLRNKHRLLILPLLNYYIQNKCQINIKNYLTVTFYEQEYLFILAERLIYEYSKNPTLIKSVIYIPQGIQKLCFKQICQQYTVKQIKNTHIQKISTNIQNKIFRNKKFCN